MKKTTKKTQSTKQDFSKKDLIKINKAFSGAKLRGADLREAIFTFADLSSAKLRGSDLREATFTYEDLSSAKLEDADLTDEKNNK